MKVLHINKSDLIGGAAIAAYRLHSGLLSCGVDSKLLVGKSKQNNSLIDNIEHKSWISKRLYPLAYRAGLNDVHLIDTYKISQHPFYKNADVLNFHNLHTGYFNYLALPKLTKQKPAVLTLHDMWSFTGHCAYSFDCNRWKQTCGQCPYPKTYPEISKDNTQLELTLKKWVYKHSNLHIVTLSNWLNQQVKESILKELPIYNIPNGIDSKTYYPVDSQTSRLELGIPVDKKVLMCSAISLDDPRKGNDLLIKILELLPVHIKQKIILLTMGGNAGELAELTEIQSIQLGYVHDEHLKNLAYSAADLFVFPSRADNLPLVLQESLACGTPMIAFDVGGVSDIVRPGLTGYLAQPENIKDFSEGIERLLENDPHRNYLAKHCREIAMTEYTIQLQVDRYLKLYEDIISSCN